MSIFSTSIVSCSLKMRYSSEFTAISENMPKNMQEGLDSGPVPSAGLYSSSILYSSTTVALGQLKTSTSSTKVIFKNSVV